MGIECYDGDGMPPDVESRPLVKTQERFRALCDWLHGLKNDPPTYEDESYRALVASVWHAFSIWYDSADRSKPVMNIEETARAHRLIQKLTSVHRARICGAIKTIRESRIQVMIESMDLVAKTWERQARGAEPALRIRSVEQLTDDFIRGLV